MNKKYPLKEYEIWIGCYHLGQGYHESIEPQMVDKITAPNFRVACMLYELRGRLSVIEGCIKNDTYVSHQDCEWFYNFTENRNSWTGKYFESKDEALLTFFLNKTPSPNDNNHER